MITPSFLIVVAPALLLALLAHVWVRYAFAQAQRVPASMTGAEAASNILAAAGIEHVAIERIGGSMTDHYDPKDRVLRLSDAVYAARTMAAVGIAAHEAGHAIQDAHQYVPLVIRNLAVPVAGIGARFGFLLLMAGLLTAQSSIGIALQVLGVVVFSGVVFFQLINLPVELDASDRARSELVRLAVVPAEQMGPINTVLNAAALTYVAATLQAVLTLLFLIVRIQRR